MSVSKSIVVEQKAAAAVTKKAARNRVDLLFIVNDVLHTDIFHHHNKADQGIFSKECVSFTTELIEHAASCISEKEHEAEKKLRALLNYWAVNQLMSAADIKSCRDCADEGLLSAQGGTPIRKRNYLLPEYHGDRYAPWNDLPASYMLESMISHPKRAIDPNRIKVAKLDKKPVSPHVHKLLDNYFENIDLKYLPTGDNPSGETQKYKLWLDPMGQTVKQDKATGDTAIISNGYGWSTKFCQDMQKHGVPQNIKLARSNIERMENTPKTRSDKQRFAESPHRRRQSSSDSRNRRDRSRSRRRESVSSYDSRRSHSRSSREQSETRRHRSPRDSRRGSDDRGQVYDARGSSQPRPPPRQYAQDPAQSRPQWGGQPAPMRNSANGPGGNFAPPPQGYNQGFVPPPQALSYAPPFSSHPGQPPIPVQFQGQFPMPPFIPPPPPQGPGGLAVAPPPPPPNYSGPFPPPPANVAAMPNAPHQFANQYGNHQANNNFGYINNVPYAQNQGGFQSGRGGYGANSRGGGYNNNNRGGYSGPQRGQRGGRY